MTPRDRGRGGDAGIRFGNKNKRGVSIPAESPNACFRALHISMVDGSGLVYVLYVY